MIYWERYEQFNGSYLRCRYSGLSFGFGVTTLCRVWALVVPHDSRVIYLESRHIYILCFMVVSLRSGSDEHRPSNRVILCVNILHGSGINVDQGHHNCKLLVFFQIWYDWFMMTLNGGPLNGIVYSDRGHGVDQTIMGLLIFRPNRININHGKTM